MTPLPHRSHTDDLLSFISTSPSPYHAVASAAQRLEKAGFRELRDTDDWTGTTGGSFVARSGALIAWYVPEGAPAHTPSGSSAPTPIPRTFGSNPLPTPRRRAGNRSVWRSTAACR